MAMGSKAQRWGWEARAWNENAEMANGPPRLGVTTMINSGRGESLGVKQLILKLGRGSRT